MIFDAMVDSLKHDWKRAIYLYIPVLVCLSLFYASTTLPAYYEQRGLIFLMINYTLSVITLNMMLHNMTGKPFSILQPMLLLPMIPLAAYQFLGVGAEVEKLLPRAVTVLAWLIFVSKMGILSRQWCDYSDKYFWTIKKQPDADKTK